MSERKGFYFFLTDWAQRANDRDFRKWERQQALFDDAEPHEKICINATTNANAVLVELRLIKWLLAIIAFALIAFMSHVAPGWWRPDWWPF